MLLRLLALIVLAGAAPAATRVLVSVVDSRSGQPITGLQASDLEFLEDKTARRVEAVEPMTGPLDVLFLVDTSSVGGAVQPAAESIIAQLGDKEQMALVTFDSAATMVQDFTTSKDLLRRALGGAKYGNNPRMLDAVMAALDGGFPASDFRKVIVLLTAGIEGPSRSEEKDVVRTARKKGVSIYPIFMHGSSRGMFETIARRTGGATFSLRDLKKTAGDKAAEQIFQAIRKPYVVTLSGNLALSEKVVINVKGREKTFVSALPLD